MEPSEVDLIEIESRMCLLKARVMIREESESQLGANSAVFYDTVIQMDTVNSNTL